MRNAFAQQLEALADHDRRIVLLSGDIGNRLFNGFQARFADRFFNCGVAEANMMGVAAGMAMCGLRPVVYTIVPFVTTRCLEQIRVDVCYHRVPVVIAGVGGGLSYAGLGATHHSCEDLGFLRRLPGMTVVCPGDAHEVRAALRAALAHDGPVYLRLGKKGEPDVHPGELERLNLGRGIEVRPGETVTILATGNILPVACEAAARLDEAGTSTQVISMHTVKPLDEILLGEVFDARQLVVTLEEHSVMGGLGGSVAEWRAERPAARAGLLRIGTPDVFFHEAGDQQYARQQLGLTAGAVARRIEGALARWADA